MAPEFFTRPDGTKSPIRGGGKGSGTTAVIAGGVALTLWAAGSGGGGAIVGGSAESAAMSAAESAVVRNIKTNFSKARQDIKRGDSRQAWRRFGLRKSTGKTTEAVECAVFSFGEVQDFFTRTPCAGMQRVQFPVSHDGRTISVLVSRVQMRSASDARQFKSLIDRHGTGDIQPVLPDTRFTGHHYDSHRDRRTVFVAETEATSGDVPDPLLDTIADAAVLLARVAI